MTTHVVSEAMDLVVVFASPDTYLGACRRGHHRPPDRFIQSARNHPSIGRVVVVDAWRSRPRRIARILSSPIREMRAVLDARASQSANGIDILSPYYWGFGKQHPPHKPSFRSDALVSMLESRIRHSSSPVNVLSFDAYIAGIAAERLPTNVVFYARDDTATFPGSVGESGGYSVVRRSGVSVVAVSEGVLSGIASTGPSLVVPNGVHPSEWASARSKPAELGSLSRPIAVYAGTLDSRLDRALIDALASSGTVGSVLLLGPVRDVSAVSHLPRNVVVHEATDRTSFCSTVVSADVGLVPHVVRDQTMSMSPLKLYEYLAAGIPVAATDLAGVRGVADDRVFLSTSVEGFVNAVDRALVRGRWDESAAQDFAERISWKRRHQAVIDLLLATNDRE